MKENLNKMKFFMMIFFEDGKKFSIENSKNLYFENEASKSTICAFY